MRKIFNKKAGHLVLAGMLAFGSTTFLTKCMFGDDGGSSKSNPTCQEDDTTCGGGGDDPEDPEDPEDPIYTNPTGTADDPIRLSMVKGTADPYDIEPSRIEPTVVYDDSGDNGYTFNTAIFEDRTKLPDNAYYTATGELDSSGHVKDKIWLGKNFVGLSGLFKNVQLKTGTVENAYLVFDVPCAGTEVEDGVTYQVDPLPPFDDKPVLDVDTFTGKAKSGKIIGLKGRIGLTSSYLPWNK